MRRPLRRAWRSAGPSLLLVVLAAATALANVGFPNIHTPRLAADAAPFGGSFDLYIGNSDDLTIARACVSGRCRRIYESDAGSNRYDMTGSVFGLTFRRGQRRTVMITARNGNRQTRWGPAAVTVR